LSIAKKAIFSEKNKKDFLKKSGKKRKKRKKAEEKFEGKRLKPRKKRDF
jgi:hypothetical protein